MMSAARRAKPLQDAAGHPDTHERAREAARQRRDNLRVLTEQARTEDRDELVAAHSKETKIESELLQARQRAEALVTQQQHRELRPDPTAEQHRLHTYEAIQRDQAKADEALYVTDPDWEIPAGPNPSAER